MGGVRVMRGRFARPAVVIVALLLITQMASLRPGLATAGRSVTIAIQNSVTALRCSETVIGNRLVQVTSLYYPRSAAAISKTRTPHNSVEVWCVVTSTRSIRTSRYGFGNWDQPIAGLFVGTPVSNGAGFNYLCAQVKTNLKGGGITSTPLVCRDIR
jgi:hypothetical protein